VKVSIQRIFVDKETTEGNIYGVGKGSYSMS
jgi:hypothetical protein